VDQDSGSDEWDILELERWDPRLEPRTEARLARQAKDPGAPGDVLISTEARETALVEPFSGTTGPDNGDFDSRVYGR